MRKTKIKKILEIIAGIGDVLIFQINRKHPIIHRIVSLNPLQTKGDHNSGQLPEEKNISDNQIIGIAIGKIPYIGWPKVKLCEMIPLPKVCS